MAEALIPPTEVRVQLLATLWGAGISPLLQKVPVRSDRVPTLAVATHPISNSSNP